MFGLIERNIHIAFTCASGFQTKKKKQKQIKTHKLCSPSSDFPRSSTQAATYIDIKMSCFTNDNTVITQFYRRFSASCFNAQC